MKAILLLTILVFLPTQLQASMSMDMPSCPVFGVVEKIELRKESGQGISHGKTLKYLDVSILTSQHESFVSDNTMVDSHCVGSNLKILQLHPSLLGVFDPSLPNVGDCIKGQSKFSADGNFKSGNWLTVEETLSAQECSDKKTD